MATFFYARVSTTEQTLAHQQTQAENKGYRFDHVLADEGVSGVNVPMKDRPQGKRLFDMLRSGDTLVVRWVDRLGRNYQDVTDTIREFVRRGVVVKTIINDMNFDGSTTDPIQMAVRDALIGFMAASAQAQAEATRAAQRAGIELKKTEKGVYKGRKPSFTRSQLETIRGMLELGTGVGAIAKETDLTRQTVYRIKDDPVSAGRALATWGM